MSSHCRRSTAALLTGLLLSVAGCGGGVVDPVATVSLQLDRGAVPLGGPATLAVEFEASPTLEALEEDYRVMVHFLDPSGELMWAADHDPPTPTSQWQPGETIAYQHRILIPMYPYVGDATVAIGLYSAISGQRLPLSGEEIGDRSYRGASIALEPQPETSFLMYQEGWHDDEYSPDANEHWRWTAGRATLSFRNPGTDAVLYLELDGRSDLFDPPQQLTVRLGETVVDEVTIGSDERIFREIGLDASAMGDGDTATVALEIDRTFVPSSIPGSAGGDERTLGVRVYYSFLEPR